MTQIVQLRKLLLLCLVFIVLGISAGCHVAHQIGITETGAPQYQKLNINYQLRNSSGALAFKEFSPEVTESFIQQAEATTKKRPHFCQSDWSNAHLQIQYPHPEGKTGLVRATVRLSKGAISLQQQETSWVNDWSGKIQDGWGSLSKKLSTVEQTNIPPKQVTKTDDEIWVYDFPKSQLDLALTDLAGSGFFNNQTRDDSSVTLSVSIDKGSVSKKWSPEPRLDGIVLLVYREGWLESFAENKTEPQSTKPQSTKKIMPVGFEESIQNDEKTKSITFH